MVSLLRTMNGVLLLVPPAIEQMTQQTKLSAKVFYLTCPYRRPENIRILPIVIAKLELSDVERQVLGTDLMERSHDPALHQRPEAFDGVGVDRTDHVFIAAMMDDAERVFLLERAVAAPFIRTQQADLVRDDFAHERAEGCSVGAVHDTGDDVSLALHGSGDDGFTRAAGSAHAATSARSFVLVLGLAADEGFVHFNNADELAEVLILQGDSDLVAHQPRGFVGTEAHISLNLQGADTLLAGQHQVNNAEPFAQVFVGVLEDRADQHGEAVPLRGAVMALPMERPAVEFVDVLMIAAWAVNTTGPAMIYEVGFAGFLVREHGLELGNGQLVDRTLLALFHGGPARSCSDENKHKAVLYFCQVRDNRLNLEAM